MVRVLISCPRSWRSAMAKYLLASLVETCLSVRVDVKTGTVRRETKYQAGTQTPVSVNPCLLPAQREELDPAGRSNHANTFRMGCAALGAGRSLRVLGSRSAARSAARAVPSRTART